MKLPKWIPHPASWASAVALFFFAGGVSIGMAAVMPLLFELLRRSPRLAWLGMLLVWIAPIAAAAAVHRVTHAIIDLGDARRGAETRSCGFASLWAGFVAWVAIIFVTLTTSFILLVIDPPPVDPGAVWNLAAEVTRGVSGLVRAVVWVVLAAYVYELERVARRNV
jgi:hypothetical protein